MTTQEQAERQIYVNVATDVLNNVINPVEKMIESNVEQKVRQYVFKKLYSISNFRIKMASRNSLQTTPSLLSPPNPENYIL